MRRVLALLLVASSLLLAGCASDDGDPPQTTPPGGTTPSGTTPATSTPATSTPATSTPATSTPATPAPAQPKVVYNGTHDFTGAPAAPNSPPKTENFTVDAGYARLQVRVVFSGGAGPTGDISVNAGAKVRLLDPSGDEALACTTGTCEEEVTPATAGAWTVEYSGTGTQKATVTITEAP